MDSDKQMDPSGVPDSGPAAPRSASRRRLLQAGLGASPVVLTFVSRPVVGADACKSPSSDMSAGSPGRTVVVIQCAGVGPVTWDATKSTAVKSTTFSSVIGSYTAQVGSHPYSDPTIAQVLQTTGTDAKSVLARNMAAAYLNWDAKTVPAAIVTPTQLSLMWTAATSGSGYVPIAGSTTTWDAAAISNWLAKTWPGSK